MNSASHRRPWAYAVTTAGALVLTVFAYIELRSARAAASAAVANHVVCEQLAGEITKLAGKPSHVTFEAASATDVARRIEAAAQFAQLPPRCVVRIEPQPARRVGETAYKEQATRVELRDVSLKQLIEFLHHLHSGESVFNAKSLRLAAAPQSNTIAPNGTASASTETWLVELTLTYLIYAPKNPPRGNSK